MPFTLSHPLAAVPLRHLGLAPAPLVIGSMVPDLVLFVPLPITYDLTHSALGLVSIDLLLGLVLLAVWSLVVRAPVVDALPAPVRTRVPEAPLRPPMPSPRDAVLVLLALLLGAITHVVWDSFTHAHGFSVRRLPFLRIEVAGLPLHDLLQYASSLAGLLGLGVLAVLALRRARPRPAPRIGGAAAPLVLLIPALLAAVVGGLIIGAAWGRFSLPQIEFVLATRTVAAAGIGLMLGSALWWARVCSRPRA